MSGSDRGHARTAGTGPAYLEVAQDLRSRILRGEFAPGTSMPAEPTLADRYDFAPIVIRNALKQLQDWGLVESADGGRVLAPPEALFDGVILSGVDMDGAVVGELLALDPRYVLCSYRPDPDHLRTLIKAERIPILTHLLGTVTDPARWLTAVLWSPTHETAPDISGSAGCTILINTVVTSPKTAARSLHALAMS